MRPTFTLASLAAVSFMIGCNSSGPKEAAQEALSKEVSCPMASVTVLPRTDLKAYDLMYGPRPTPPSELAADPSRLAVWQQNQKKVEDGYAHETVWQARGCNNDQIYVCVLGDHPDGSKGYACMKPAHAPAK